MGRKKVRRTPRIFVAIGFLVANGCSGSKVSMIRSSNAIDAATERVRVIDRSDGAPDRTTVDRTTVDAAAETRPDVVGACTGLPAGTPAPAGACSDGGPASCGFDGTCDGVGGCRRYPAGTLCAASTCLDGATFQPPSVCDGQGACKAASPLTCSPYICVNGACYVDECKVRPADCVATPNRDASPG